MQTNPYLSFNGNCREAMTLYAEVLGGKVEAMMTHGETPMAAEFPPEQQDKIIHACVNLGETILMAGDAPGDQYQPPAGFSVNITLASVAEAERVFAALAEGAVVHMALAETFWAKRFAMFTDRYGTPWMINCFT
ncbi:VOC family protein [Ferrovibrio sp.]|uniref:VOC family protein n=1 Tax=Ferrovibrio sp. TaxID=1917215 RepID=UPI001B6DB8DA|nr:VOC family protein [Ferrovibrio sp.]MBP7065331.1 VOC family protein [Ferrovibrio sp.]